jgi:hypothetical protein
MIIRMIMDMRTVMGMATAMVRAQASSASPSPRL